MNTSESNLALKSTGQRVYKLFDVSELYVCVRIPAEHSWHNDRIETVRNDSLRTVKPAIV